MDSLAVFDTWQGATAQARRHAGASLRQDLDAHGNESLLVARAAAKAADDIAHLQSALDTLRRDAAELEMTIECTTNTVVPSLSFSGPAGGSADRRDATTASAECDCGTGRFS